MIPGIIGGSEKRDGDETLTFANIADKAWFCLAQTAFLMITRRSLDAVCDVHRDLVSVWKYLAVAFLQKTRICARLNKFAHLPQPSIC
mgnify:FL=1